MDLYFLNFKRILVVLTAKDMRLDILGHIKTQEIDVNVKFVDSYLQAAKLINETKHDPFDHIILNLSVNNSKLEDFVEYISPTVEKDPAYLIEYTREGMLSSVDIKFVDEKNPE